MQFRFFDWLNTVTARQVARGRFGFMQEFVAQMREELGADS
jgi:hypothetical protein